MTVDSSAPSGSGAGCGCAACPGAKTSARDSSARRAINALFIALLRIAGEPESYVIAPRLPIIAVGQAQLGKAT